MRALLLSDIHANIDALEAVLASAPGYDVVWNLGDVVGYGAAPNEVIERARGLGGTFVRGNHDRASCGQLPLDDFNLIASSAIRWTRHVLTPEHTQWLEHMAAGPVMPDPQVSCMHGSYFDEDEYVFSVRDAWLPLRRAPTPINFFGHTHLQGGFATNGDDWADLKPLYSLPEDEEDSSELILRAGARYLINPGSVGQPRDGDWRAAFALYDDQRRAVEFRRVPYDVRLAQMRIYRAGLPDRLALRLREGR